MYHNWYDPCLVAPSPHSDPVVAEDEMDVSPLNLGMIAAYYNISCRSLSLMSLITLTPGCRRDSRALHALAEGTKLKGLLQVVLSSKLFPSVGMRIVCCAAYTIMSL